MIEQRIVSMIGADATIAAAVDSESRRWCCARIRHYEPGLPAVGRVNPE